MRGVISAARRKPGAGGQAIAAELANRRVFQRSGTSAVVPLSGTYTGTAGAIQGRIVDASSSAEIVTWTTVSASPTGGTWSGTMTVPQGGWYKVQTRLQSNPTGIASASNQFGVGDIWMMAGQSQQARMSTLSASPPTFDPKSVYFNGSVWEFPGTLTGTNGNGGIRFLNLMVANTGVPQALIQTSVEGTSIVDWEVSDTAYTNARAQLVAAGSVAGILWHQGGTGIGVVTRSDYKNRLLDLKTRFASAVAVLNFGVFPLMHRTTPTDTDLDTQETRRAHYEYISENPGTVNLGWTPAVPMADDVHQTAAGSEVIAYAYANAMLNKLGVISTSNIGPSITGVTRSGAVLTLTVQHTSGSSLKINSGTQATGFQVLPRSASFSDAAALAISSITLGTNTVTITLAAVPAQEVDVYYQYGRFDNTSPVFDNTTVLGQTTGLALQPLMDPVQSGVTSVVSTQALKFDGTTGYVSYPLDALWNFADADWTVGVWYNIDDPAGTTSQYFVSTGAYGALQTFNLFVYESGATGVVLPGMIEVNVRGSGTAIQVLGPTNSAHLDTAWRLITVERIKSTETLNIYVTPANGSRTLYHSASVAGLGAITPTVATNLATRAPATAGSARWLNGGLYSVFKMTGTLTAVETQAIAAGSDIVTDLAKTPQVYTKLNSLTSPIANSGTGGALPATIQGGVSLGSGPSFTVQSIPVDVTTFTTKTGDGVTSIDPAAKTLTIAFGTAATSLRGQHFVTPGIRYRVSWSMSSTNATQGQAGFGTSLGGPQYRPTISGVAGVNTFDFTATADTLYPTFQRASTGETTFSGITLTQIPEVTWANISPQPITPSSWSALSAGVTVDGTTGAITIPAAGTLIFAAGPFTTVPGKLYRLVWTVTGNVVAVPIGTTQGGTTFKSNSVTHAVGNHTYEFTPTGTTTWIQFQRQTSGTAVVSNIALQEVSSAPAQSSFTTDFTTEFV